METAEQSCVVPCVRAVRNSLAWFCARGANGTMRDQGQLPLVRKQRNSPAWFRTCETVRNNLAWAHASGASRTMVKTHKTAETKNAGVFYFYRICGEFFTQDLYGSVARMVLRGYARLRMQNHPGLAIEALQAPPHA